MTPIEGAGAGCWYAYRSAGGRTRKRYLGPPARITLAQLEGVAAIPAAGATMRDPAPPQPATKLVPPQSPVALVEREGILAALEAAHAAPTSRRSPRWCGGRWAEGA